MCYNANMTEIYTIQRGTAPKWDKIYDGFEAKGQTSGAAVYSRHFCKNILPDIKTVLKESDFKKVCVITVNDLTPKFVEQADLIIVLLHVEPSEDMQDYMETYIGKIRELNATAAIFSLTSVWETHICLIDLLEPTDARYRSLFLPMTIDAKEVRRLAGTIPKKKYQDRILFFGNSYMSKTDTKNNIITALTYATAAKNGKIYKFDSIHDNEYLFSHEGEERLDEKTPVTRAEMFKIIKQYQYVVATSIAAQESMELGAKVIFAGRKFGGIITSDAEYDIQGRNNFSGDVCTFSSSPLNCWYAINHARIYRAMMWDDVRNGFIPDLIRVLAEFDNIETNKALKKKGVKMPTIKNIKDKKRSKNENR